MAKVKAVALGAMKAGIEVSRRVLKQFIYHAKSAPVKMQPVLKIKLKKSESCLLGQCTSNPSIIVSGKNRTEIRTKLASCISGYVQAFPESKR